MSIFFNWFWHHFQIEPFLSLNPTLSLKHCCFLEETFLALSSKQTLLIPLDHIFLFLSHPFLTQQHIQTIFHLSIHSYCHVSSFLSLIQSRKWGWINKTYTIMLIPGTWSCFRDHLWFMSSQHYSHRQNRTACITATIIIIIIIISTRYQLSTLHHFPLFTLSSHSMHLCAHLRALFFSFL